MSGFKLSARQGPKVVRDEFDSLDDAILALEGHAKRIRSDGPLEVRKMIREFEPGHQVAGRVELTTGSLLRRGVTAGVDVMGDGSFIPYRGGMGRSELEPGDRGPFEAIREALAKGV